MLKQIKIFAGLVILTTTLMLLAGCSDDTNQNPSSPGTDWPPTVPATLFPPDGARDIWPDYTLSWSSHDPDGGSITYDLYFGADSIPIHDGVWQISNSFPLPWGLQENARQLLSQIYSMQTAYHSIHHSYCLNGVIACAGDSSFFDNLGVVPSMEDPYCYAMTASADVFTCVASANVDNDPEIDRWSIDQAQTITCLTDDIDVVFEAPVYYFWQVIARDDEDNMVEGPVWRFRTTSSEFNHRPDVPSLVSPDNGHTVDWMGAVLAWECSDIDNDPLLYVIYLGTSPQMSMPWRRNVSRTVISPPQRSRAQCREILQQVYLLEDAYHGVYNSYWMDGVTASYENNGFYFMGIIIDSLDIYTYAITAGLDNFTCTATGNLDDDATLDTWTINQDGELVCTSDDMLLLLGANDVTYYWQVVAEDSGGLSRPGPVWSFIVADSTY